MKKIFVDTWAWCALSGKKDKNHQKAVKEYNELSKQGIVWVTTNFVLSETYTLIRNRLNLDLAIEFGEGIHISANSGMVKILRVSEPVEQRAWGIFKKYKDKDFSFVDCTSFVVMKELGINTCFTGDDHFSQFGFLRIPIDL